MGCNLVTSHYGGETEKRCACNVNSKNKACQWTRDSVCHVRYRAVWVVRQFAELRWWDALPICRVRYSVRLVGICHCSSGRNILLCFSSTPFPRCQNSFGSANSTATHTTVRCVQGSSCRYYACGAGLACTEGLCLCTPFSTHPMCQCSGNITLSDTRPSVPCTRGPDGYCVVAAAKNESCRCGPMESWSAPAMADIKHALSLRPYIVVRTSRAGIIA
jgi:hypothetical protein